MNLIYWLSIIQFVFLSFFSFSQKQPISLGIQYHYGYLLNHSPKSGVHGPSILTIDKGIEFNILWQSQGTKEWHKYYGYPKWGFSFIYFNLGDREINNRTVHFGNVYSILFHNSIKAIKREKFEFNIRLGTGFGIFDKVYESESNKGNLWISLPFNTSMHANFETLYFLNKYYQLNISAAFTHYSNGALNLPNLGVNFPTLNCGIRYNINPERHGFRKDTAFNQNKRHYFYFMGALGLKASGNSEFERSDYLTYATSIQYGNKIGKISKLLVSFDAFKDNTLVNQREYNQNEANIMRLGVWFGHEFCMGRIGLFSGLGYYIYKKTNRDAPAYIKVGLRYHISDHIFAAFVLKTHFGQADNFEWTLGYSL